MATAFQSNAFQSNAFQIVLATYRLIKDHWLNGPVNGLAYHQTGTTITEGTDVPLGWIPTLAVDPLNSDAATKFYNAGPRDLNTAPTNDLSEYDPSNFVGSQFIPVTHWQQLPGPRRCFQLTGLGASFPPTCFFGLTSSAGVFNSSGALVRTLWSGVTNSPFMNNPAAAWDGTLDDGSVALAGTYTIKTLFNSVTYTWEGVIGNTKSEAASHTVSINPQAYASVHTSSYHAHGEGFQDLCIDSTGQMWFVHPYDERFQTFSQATTADPNTNNTIGIQGFRQVAPYQQSCCTAGSIVYFNDADTPGNLAWIWGYTTTLPHTNVVFPSGFFDGNIYQIGRMADPGDGSNYIDDIAVQKAGSVNNILFLVRSKLSTISTFDKISGAPLQNYTLFVAPYRITTNPVTGDLWVAHQNVTAFPAYAAINLKNSNSGDGHGSSTTAKFTAASFTYTAPSGYAALNGTLDPLTLKGDMVLSGGNLTVGNPTGTANSSYAYSQNSSTKFYFEVLINTDHQNATDNDMLIGIVQSNTFNDPSSLGGGLSIGWANAAASFGVVYGPNNAFRGTMAGVGFTTGDNVGVAVDISRQVIWWRKNGGNWNNNASADPVAGVGGVSLQGIAATVVPVVSKMTCDSLGNLTDTGVSISGLTKPLDIDGSTDGSMILVADGGTSQQLKAFNSTDGSVRTAWGTSGVFGVAGGYVNSPAVAHNKFLFSLPSNAFVVNPSIAFAPDNSFWVTDGGNNRTQHFSSGNSPTFIEEVMFQPIFYSNQLCYNDDTRVFIDYQEYKIDYSKPLSYGNGSWTLVNNWSASLPNIEGQFQDFKFVGTYSNGRTYTRFFNSTTGLYQILELTSSGTRDTGVVIPGDVYIDRQFNIWSVSRVTTGSTVTYKKNTFTGFDISGNPTWQDNPAAEPFRVVLTSQVLPALFPATGSADANLNPNLVEQLANGVIPVFNPDGFGGAVPNNNHVGGIDGSTGLVKFSTHPATPSNFGFSGNSSSPLIYPESPYFYPGNDQFAGSIAMYKPGATDFFTGYNGENFGNNQTNFWYHWHESGLLINRFGCAAPYFGIQVYVDGLMSHLTPTLLDQTMAGTYFDPITANPFSWKGMPGLGGNARWASLAFQNGNYYLHHNDEWYHGGLHRWKVSNLSSVQFGPDVIVSAGNYVQPTAGSIDLLAGLPYNAASVPDGTAGWHRFPTVNDTSGNFFSGPWFLISTNRAVVNPHESPSLTFERTDNVFPGTAYLYRDFTRSSTGNWSLNATIMLSGDSQAFSPGPPALLANFSILDASGKKIVTFHNGFETHFLSPNAGQSLWVNSSVATQGTPIHTPTDNTTTGAWTTYCTPPRPLTISANIAANTITVAYGDFSVTVTGTADVGANMAGPTRFRFDWTSTQSISYYVTFTTLIFTG